MPWGNGLIRESSIKKIPLIYSLNKGYVKDRISETGWKDYFTYVPDIVPNMYFNSRTKVNYPILTFGINSNSKDCHLFFQTLSLMPLKMIIDDYLLDIHRSFNFAFDKLMKKNK